MQVFKSDSHESDPISHTAIFHRPGGTRTFLPKSILPLASSLQLHHPCHQVIFPPVPRRASDSYLGDCANCCAAVTASSSDVTSKGSLLQPGCFRILSSCFTVRSTVAFEHKSTLLMTMKKGTLRAIAKPRCSRVVPAARDRMAGRKQVEKTGPQSSSHSA